MVIMVSIPPQSEKDIVISKLFETNYDSILRLCISKAGQYDAENIASQTFLDLYMQWDEIENRSEPALFAWLYKVAYRYCFDCREQKLIENSDEMLYNIWKYLEGAPANSPSDQEVLRLVKRARRQLTKQDLDLLDRVMAGEGDESLCKHFGVNRVAIRQRRKRLFDKIRRLIKKLSNE